MNRVSKNTSSFPIRLGVGIALALCILAPAQAQSLLTTNGKFFAWPDTEVPGQPGVYFGGSVDFSTLAEDGTLAFRADLYGAGTSGVNGKALFTGASTATLAMLARWSDPAPGLPGLSLLNITGTQGIHSTISISPSGGYKLWSSPLSGPGVSTFNDTAIFLSSPAGHVLLAREGDPAPGTAGAIYADTKQADYQFTKVNRNGTVVFDSQLSGGDVSGNTNNLALFTGTPGALSILIRTGSTVLTGPITAAGIGSAYQLDNNGRVIYTLKLAGAGVTTANDDSIWFYTPGSGSQLLVREGDPAPGTAGASFASVAGYQFPGISSTSLTRSGRYEFTTNLVGGDVVAGLNERALYAGIVGGPLTLIARDNQPAPGTDAVFAGFSPFYSLINDAGDVAFQALVTGGTTNPTNNSGIWIWKAGTLSLAVRSGAAVPTVPPGLKTPGIAPGTTYGGLIGHNMQFNDLDQIIVVADITGGDVIPGIDHSILLAYDPAKGAFLAGRSAEDIEGVPGNVRTTRYFSIIQFNNSDGVSLGLGKNGTVGMTLGLTEGAAAATLDLNCYPSTAYGIDSDGDGFGNPATRVDVCSGVTPPAGYVPNASDCNDANASVHQFYYHDADGDGYGNLAQSICGTSTPPAGYVIKSTDCDDTKAAVHPGASDTNCDGLDNNCNFEIDEGFQPYDTFCGVGACASMGSAQCASGVFSDSCVPGTPTTETCNGVDDNCDGTIDNAAAPTGTPAVTVSRPAPNTARLSWPAVPASTGYDLVKGSVVALRSSGGNFTTSTISCLGNNLVATTADDTASVPAGQGFWYLVRAMNCGGNASYNSGSASQIGSRDAEIAASAVACP